MNPKVDLVRRFFEEASGYQEICDRLPREKTTSPDEERLVESRGRLKEFARELLTELLDREPTSRELSDALGLEE